MKAKTALRDSTSPVNEPLEMTDKRAWQLYCAGGDSSVCRVVRSWLESYLIAV